MPNTIHDPDEFSYLEILEQPSYILPVSIEQSSTNEASRPTSPPNFHKFSKLPMEIQSMIWEIAARPLAQRRTVEIHEVELEVMYRYRDADEESYHIHSQDIKHFRSQTERPSLLNTLLEACRESRHQAWKYFDEDIHMGNEFCSDMVYFNFSRDWAYLTRNTLLDLMRFWHRCSDLHPEFPLKDGAGKTFRKHLRYLVFDATILLGDDVYITPQGKEVWGERQVMEALGPGLASFSSLEEIILVQSPDYRGYVDGGLSTIRLLEPEQDSNAEFTLRVAADFLRFTLDYYFNEFEYPRHKPPCKKPRKARNLPIVRTMVRTLQ